MKKQKPIWAIVFGLLLTAFTTYVMLDAFVIRRPMQTNATEINLSLFVTPSPDGRQVAQDKTPTPAPTDTPTPTPDEGKKTPTPVLTGDVTPEPTEEVTPTPAPTDTPTPVPDGPQYSDTVISTDTMYSNDHLYITISEYREHDTQIHVAEVWMTSAQYLLTAFAKDTFGRHYYQTTSEIAAAKDAVFAINGDNYGAREGGYVIRNGVMYKRPGNTRKDVLCIMPSGDFEFSHYYKATAEQLRDRGTWQALTFGPVLIDDSKLMVDVDTEVDYCYVTNPRTAIGMVEPLHYFFVVADGRTKKSHGLSVYELADFMKRLGCTKAFNLDGGGSSTMVFRGKVINFPTSEGDYLEREVTDIVYVK